MDTVDEPDETQSLYAVGAPTELREHGVAVYEAPEVPRHVRVVNLVNGRVVEFPRDEPEPPDRGYYVDYDTLMHYAEENGVPLEDVDGRIAQRQVAAEEPAQADARVADQPQ